MLKGDGECRGWGGREMSMSDVVRVVWLHVHHYYCEMAGEMACGVVGDELMLLMNGELKLDVSKYVLHIFGKGK